MVVIMEALQDTHSVGNSSLSNSLLLKSFREIDISRNDLCYNENNI